MNSGIFKKLGIVLLAIVVVLQFFQPIKNDGSATGPNDIEQTLAVPPAVLTSLKTSCYDCHSNHTEYPWYTVIQPVGMWLQHHVNEGKGELNFSEFKTYTAKRQAHKMEEIAEMLEENEMPLSSYTLIHKNAVLNETQKAEMIAWAKLNHNLIKQNAGAQLAPASDEAAHEHSEAH
jgi:hypothetical protein